MFVSYSYDELLNEIKSDIKEGLLKPEDFVYVVRDKSKSKDLEYEPIIDYYYEYSDEELEEIKVEDKNVYDDIIKSLVYAEKVNVQAVIDEMETWNALQVVEGSQREMDTYMNAGFKPTKSMIDNDVSLKQQFNDYIDENGDSKEALITFFAMMNAGYIAKAGLNQFSGEDFDDDEKDELVEFYDYFQETYPDMVKVIEDNWEAQSGPIVFRLAKAFKDRTNLNKNNDGSKYS